MAADFKKLATSMKGEAVIAEVDCTVEKELASFHEIQGFPTLKLYSRGKLVSTYKGARTEDAMANFVKRSLEPATVALNTAEEFTAYQESGKTVIVSNGNVDGFESLARELRELLADSVYLVAANAELFKQAGGADDAKVVLRTASGEVFSTSESGEELEKFLLVHSLPLVGQINGDTAALYQRIALPLFIGFVADEQNIDDETRGKLEAVARAHRGVVSAVTADGKKFSRFMEHMGLKGDLPQFGIHNMMKDENFPVEAASGVATETELLDFAGQFARGELKVKVKSEPIPETQDEAVVKLVGDSWTTVIDGTRDVLVEQYAPWCGHCKNLAPTYLELAESLKDVKTLVIAKMDATVNDAPSDYKARSFPTIHFFPAGKPGMVYKGGRTKQDFIKFLQEHATHKFEIPSTISTEQHDEL